MRSSLCPWLTIKTIFITAFSAVPTATPPKSRTEISARSNITAALKASSAKAPSSIVFLTNTAAVRERLKIRISSAITTSSCDFPNRAQRDISYRRRILRFRGIRTEILSARRKSPAVTKTNHMIILCTTGMVILSRVFPAAAVYLVLLPQGLYRML